MMTIFFLKSQAQDNLNDDDGVDENKNNDNKDKQRRYWESPYF